MKKTIYARIYTTHNTLFTLTPHIEIQNVGEIRPEDENLAHIMLNKGISHIVATEDCLHHIEIETLTHDNDGLLISKKTEFIREW